MLRFFDHVRFDARDAWRFLRNSPGFTAIAVVMLAVGIGINAAVFTVVDATLFRGFRLVDRNDRILYIGTQKDGRGCCASYPDFEDWRTQATSFVGMAAVADEQISLGASDAGAERYGGTHVTANTFTLVGQRPILGRDFSASDEVSGAPPVAILSHRLWQRLFDRDPGVVGRTLRMNGISTTVIGVMPEEFSFPQNQDVWLPLVRTAARDQRSARTLWFAFGRLADGATFESAKAELATIGQRLGAMYPATNQGWVPVPRTFAEFFVAVDAPNVYGALWGVVAFVLLIACANLANLLLTRALQRSRDVSVRIALGAARSNIVRLLMFEGLMLSGAGGALGWALAVWGVRLYALVANPPARAWSDHLLDYSMGTRALIYTVAISVGTVLLFSLAPAVRLMRVNVSANMRDGSRGSIAGKRGRRASTSLVGAQLALTLVLLSGAGVMLRSFMHLYTSDVGVETDHVLVALMNLRGEGYADPGRLVSFFDRLRDRLHSLPEVESMTVASVYPGSGALETGYQTEEDAPLDEGRRPTVTTVRIGDEYFQTVGARLIAGREFNPQDRNAELPPVIVNEEFAHRHWPRQGALGKRLRLYQRGAAGPWSIVAGVAPNIAQDLTRQKNTPVVYVPFRGRPLAEAWVVVRTRVAPNSMIEAFRREVHAIDADLPVWLGPFSLSDQLASSGVFWSLRNTAALLTIFAVAALLIASTGFYAVVAQTVNRRTQEIALRMAIGATSRDITSLVLREGLVPVTAGLIVGLIGSVAVNRLFQTQLVQMSATDPATLFGTSAVLVGCAAFGCLIPAWRVIRLDPVSTLKRE